MKKMTTMLALVLMAAGARADQIMDRWVDHDLRERVRVAEALAELNPALAAMQFEMENIDGRRRAGTPRDGDQETYAQIVRVLMMDPAQTVAYSKTPEGKVFFARWSKWARENKKFINDWKDSL